MTPRVRDVFEVDEEAMLPKGRYRIVFFDAAPTDAVYLMGLTKPWRLPERKCLSALVEAMGESNARIRLIEHIEGAALIAHARALAAKAFDGSALNHDLKHENEDQLKLSEHDQVLRDSAWRVIEPLVASDRAFELFDPNLRGNRIATRAADLKIHRRSIYRILMCFWAKGMTLNACLPDRPRSGPIGS